MLFRNGGPRANSVCSEHHRTQARVIPCQCSCSSPCTCESCNTLSIPDLREADVYAHSPSHWASLDDVIVKTGLDRPVECYSVSLITSTGLWPSETILPSRRCPASQNLKAHRKSGGSFGARGSFYDCNSLPCCVSLQRRPRAQTYRSIPSYQPSLT